MIASDTLQRSGRRPLRTIVIAGLVAGALDITYAFIIWGLRGVSPIRIGQSIASGLLGREAAVVTSLGAGITLALLSWVYVATVRPLRDAAAHAAAIAAARNGAAPPTPRPARRVDEIGAIINGLNRHLHSIGAASPTSPRRVPPSTTLVPTPWPGSRIPRHTPATGHRGPVKGGSASWPVDDEAFGRSRGAREADTVVVAGS